MKNSIWTSFILLSICTTSIAQNDKKNANERIIEVIGTAEMSIPPNEVTLKLSLSERVDGREKITVEQQETDLKGKLKELGIDVQKDLKIVDMSTYFLTQKRRKSLASTKDYHLTITNLALLGKIQELTETLKVDDLDLLNATNTDLPKFRKEVKIEAIKAAKEKAEYLLNAIGQKVGKVVYVQELTGHNEANNHDLDPYRSNTFSRKTVIQDEKNELGLRNITLMFSLLVRFEIE